VILLKAASLCDITLCVVKFYFETFSVCQLNIPSRSLATVKQKFKHDHLNLEITAWVRVKNVNIPHTRCFQNAHEPLETAGGWRKAARKYHQSVFLDSTAKLTPIKASAEKISKIDWKSKSGPKSNWLRHLKIKMAK
jgi:hypothetical protein